MTDLNEWNLFYTRWMDAVAVSYDFGALSNDSPMTVQMEIGDADIANGDEAHGLDDAILMGRDLIGGSDLTFSLTTIPDGSAQPWTAAMDKVSEFEAAWRGYGLRDKPGVYALLTNTLRDRFAFGRPRNFARKNARARRGVIEYVATFRTATPYWYGHTVNDVIVLPNVAAVNQAILGDEPTFPVMRFQGPFDTASFTWTPPGFVFPWTVTIDHALAVTQQVTVDTRPLFRGATYNDGTSRSGWVTGQPISKCRFFPTPGGHGTFQLATTGVTNADTKCEVSWYTAYAGL